MLVLTYLAGKLVYRLRDILLLMVVAGFLAVILNPLVVYVQRWVRPRGWAVTIVTVWAVLVFVRLVLAFGWPLVNGLTHLAHRLPLYVQAASNGHGWIGHLVRRLHLEAWVQRNAPKLQSIGTSLAKPALNFGKARADRYSRLAYEINQSVTGYVLGDLATSVIAGVVVFTTLAALGIPFPLLWALWVALVDFLPMIGGALAGIPTVLFAAGHSLTAGIVTAAAFIGYQQLENHVLNPVIMSKTVKINPLLVLVAILVGSSIGAWLGGLFGGFVAASISIPCAAALQVIVKDIWQATGPGGLLSDEPGPDPVPDGPAGSGTGSVGVVEDGLAEPLAGQQG